MMKNHDLSANVVKLDYNALLITAEIATYWTRVEIERKLQTIQDAHIYNRKDNPYSIVTYAAQDLVKLSEHLAIAAETAEALNAMKIRSELEILNRPEVKERE